MQTAVELVQRSRRFAVQALRFYKALPANSAAQVPGLQFMRAATSADSNYGSAKRARSRKEFIAKLGTVLEEMGEAVGWLEVMSDANIASDAELLSEARQLVRIFGASLATAKRNYQTQLRAQKAVSRR